MLCRGRLPLRGGLSLETLRWLRLALCLLALLLRFAIFIAGARCYVETLVDMLGDRLDFGAQLLLDTIEVESVLIGHKIDCKTQMTKTSGTTNSMEVRLRILWEVEINDDIYGLNVNATSKKVGAYEIAADTFAEIVEDTITMRLQHLCMRIETRVPKLRDLLREELDSVCRVAKYDRLVDLELRESVNIRPLRLRGGKSTLEKSVFRQ